MSARPDLPACLLGCLLLLAFLGGAFASPTRPAKEGRRANSCPGNWIYNRGYCYGYFTERKTWDEAEEECKRYSPRGHLASIHSLGAIRVLARHIAKQKNKAHTWIGLRNNKNSRQWKWSDGSDFYFKNWAPGQPDNQLDKEDCVVLDKYSGFRLWHDYPCDSKFPFLCRHQL